jgi:regulator of RNase E activity RraA
MKDEPISHLASLRASEAAPSDDRLPVLGEIGFVGLGHMGTAMAARNYSGAVIDGGVRDVAHLRKIGFPVFATGIVPSTSVTHYRFDGANVPVVCDGVTVRPGDIVVADSDGVAIVPKANAQEVLELAQQMDFKEHSMYAYIEKYKSIVEAVKKFGRL